MESRFAIDRRQLVTGAAALAAASAMGAVLSPAAFGAAPMFGASRASIYRTKLGQFEVTTILDGAILMDGPHPFFATDQTPEVAAAFAKENLIPATKMENTFTPVIVNTGKEVVIFDTGNGAARRPNAGKLASLLEAAGFKPEQIDIVAITHCHPDHIGGIMEGGKPLFPNARYVIGETEYNFWSSKDRLTGPTEAVGKLTQANVVPHVAKMTFLKPESEVVPGIRAVNAFGHTPGMLGFHIESNGKRLLVMTDVTNHYVMSLMRPEWHVRYDMDKDAAVATRKRLLDMLVTDRIPMTGYHMPFPAIGFVEKSGGGYRWSQASYQLHL